ncbi:hypothetical protein B4907_22935, partial [Yersinia kristensenii]
DSKNQRQYDIHAQIVVNAAGIWGQHIAEYADLRIRMFPAKGAYWVRVHGGAYPHYRNIGWGTDFNDDYCRSGAGRAVISHQG